VLADPKHAPALMREPERIRMKGYHRKVEARRCRRSVRDEPRMQDGSMRYTRMRYSRASHGEPFDRLTEQESGDPVSGGWEEVDMPSKVKDPPPKPDTKKTLRRPDKEASPEPEHVDPPPRDVREAPAPNPNGDKKS